jgi:hypothetical protein
VIIPKTLPVRTLSALLPDRFGLSPTPVRSPAMYSLPTANSVYRTAMTFRRISL